MNRWSRHEPVRIIHVRNGADGYYATSYFRDGTPSYTGPVKSDIASAITAVSTWHSLAGWRASDVVVFPEEDRR